MTEQGEATGPRVAIVTGAARGIGAATAVRLGREGFAVAVCDLDEGACADTVAQIEKNGGKALAVGVDVADSAQVSAAVARVATELGPPVVLVNNAGVLRDNLLFKMSDDDWDTVMSVHLRGSFLMSRAAQEHMTKAGWGRIVNMSSVSALGNRGQANYSAAKAGLIGLTKAAARELAHWGILVNAVAPGLIETDMAAAIPEEAREALLAQVPLKRIGTPREVAEMVGFLAGDGATYVTGQVFHVNGGLYM